MISKKRFSELQREVVELRRDLIGTQSDHGYTLTRLNREMGELKPGLNIQKQTIDALCEYLGVEPILNNPVGIRRKAK